MMIAKIIKEVAEDTYKAYVAEGNEFYIKIIDGEAFYGQKLDENFEFVGESEFVGDDFKIDWDSFMSN